MPTISDLNSISGAIQSLVYGFVACWIFYSMTAHPKPTTTEQGIQALIFTAFIQAAVVITKWTALLIGRWPRLNFGVWPRECDFGSALFYGVLFGFILAVCANQDFPFCQFRKLGWTKKHSFPSVWFHFFNDSSWSPWAVLHLIPSKESVRGPCRLTGYIQEWPDDPKSGHFVMVKAAWLHQDGTVVELDTVESLMVSAAEVEMVEFLKRTPVGEEKPEEPIVIDQKPATANLTEVKPVTDIIAQHTPPAEIPADDKPARTKPAAEGEKV